MISPNRPAQIGVLILLVLLGTSPVHVTAASQGPNFSGTWVDGQKVVEGSTSGNGAGLFGAVVAGPEVTILHAGNFHVTRFQGSRKLVYDIPLDGKPVAYTVQALGGVLNQVSKAAWIGERLEVTTTVTRPPESWTTKQVFSLKDGALVVETLTATLRNQTAVYRKK